MSTHLSCSVYLLMVYQGLIDEEFKRESAVVDACNGTIQNSGCWETRIKGELDARLELNRLHQTRLCRRRTGRTLDLPKLE